MNSALAEMSLITSPTTLPLVAPSILSADFANLGRGVQGSYRCRCRLAPSRRDGWPLCS